MAIAGWLTGLLALLVVLAVVVRWAEPRLSFSPARGPTPPPSGFERFVVRTADGVDLVGWQSGIDTSRPLLLYLCGNAGNLADRADLLLTMAQYPVGIVAFNYRGAGESTGSPSEEGVYRDAEAVYSYAVDTLEVDPRRFVLWGHSIGGAVATELALRRPVAGLVLQSTIRSAAVMARRMLCGLPIDWLMSYRFDNERNLSRLDRPILFIHGTHDEVVPVADAAVLHSVSLNGKELWLVPGADHNHVHEAAGAAFFERIVTFAGRVAAGPSSGR